ncbi:recombinase family protein, partial [Minwuia thermotolerans]|uniref:recombinase family protein n=1 Tax=Minwuia thermotolerans TaxID=2056226 RepID=UPI000D6DC4EC
VSFVSVTQQFNTTTSMGRLTLNVLLSFAQFEREVTAERIRDKIAASKKKGMWMGGAVPIGYRVEDRKLVIDAEAAATVRRIFQLYLGLGSVREVKAACDGQGIVTSIRTSRSGRRSGGDSFSRGHLYWLLRNPIYIGRVKHRGQTYKGEHEPIIDMAMWETVQAMLDGRAKRRRAQVNTPSPSHLLKGRLFDETGERLYATQAQKRGRRYSYYTSKHLVTRKAESSSGWRLPARELDRIIVDQIVALLRDPLRVMDLMIHGRSEDAAIAGILDVAIVVANVLAGDDDRARREMLESLLERVDLRDSCIVVHLRPSAIDFDTAGRKHSMVPGDEDGDAAVAVELPVKLQRRGTGSRIILANGEQEVGGPDANLIRLIADAHRWNRMLAEGEVTSLQELARRDRVDRSDIGRTLNLAYLAPDIIEAILDGRQPAGLTAYSLSRMSALPLDWSEQRRALGFGA